MSNRSLVLMTMAVLVAAGGPAMADFTFHATYQEQWVSGTDGVFEDVLPDLFSLEITADVGTPFSDLDITKVTITFPQVYGVFMDTTDDDNSHPGTHFGYTQSMLGLTAPTVPSDADLDGATSLDITFAGGFGSVDDRLDFSLDLDNSNAVVRGYWAGPHGAIGGNSTTGPIINGNAALSALLTVDYIGGGIARTASGYFWGDSGDTGNARGEVTLIPAPGAALLAMLGMPMIGWAKRRLA